MSSGKPRIESIRPCTFSQPRCQREPRDHPCAHNTNTVSCDDLVSANAVYNLCAAVPPNCIKSNNTYTYVHTYIICIDMRDDGHIYNMYVHMMHIRIGEALVYYFFDYCCDGAARAGGQDKKPMYSFHTLLACIHSFIHSL